MRIRTKLQIAFISTSIIVAASILSISYFSMVTHFEQQEGNRLKSNVGHSAKVIDNFMFNRVADFNVLSNNPLFSKSSNEIISQYLLRVVNQYPFYESLFYVNKNGIVLSSSDQKFISVNILQLEPDIEDEFIKTISGGPEDVYISDVSKFSQKEIEEDSPLDIELLSDVIDLNGNVVGVLVGFINMQVLNELIFDIDNQIFDIKNTYLVNNKGLVLMSGNKEIGFLQPHPDLLLNDLQQKVERSKNGFYIYENSKDIKVISGYADLSEYGTDGVGNWSLLSTAPYNEVMQPIYNMIYKAFLFFLLIISVILVFIVIFSHTLSKPIVELEQAISNFGINGKPINLKSSKKDEIGSLSESFKTMTENLYDFSEKRNIAEHKLIASKEKAEESENHLRTILETEPECIKQLNAKGELIYMNPAGLEMIEADNLEMAKGQPMMDLIIPNYQRAFKKLTNEVFKGNSGQLKFEIKGLKGTNRWLETHAVPFKDTNGKIISLLGVTRDITSRKDVEEQLINSEQLFRRLSSNAPVAIFQTDKVGSCNYVNEEWMKYSGMSFEAAMGFGWTNAIHPDDKERVMNEVEQSIVARRENVSEFRFQNLKKQTTWLSTKTVELHDAQNKLYGYIGIAIDITERKKAEEQIIKSEKYLENIINNIGDPLFVKDEKSKMLLANNALCSLFNLSRADIIGKTLAENVPPEERESFLSIDKQVLSTGIENINEETLTMNENETRIISTKKTRFTDDSGNKFLIGIIRDITERKNTENEIVKLNEGLEQKVLSRTLELKNTNKELEAFSYSISHDLRAPLRAINGFSNFLYQDYSSKLDAEGKRFIDIIRQNAIKMDTLISDLLNFSRVSKSSIKIIKTDMKEVIISMYREVASDKEKNEFEFIIDKVPKSLCDVALIKQVWQNLIGNALKYSSKSTLKKIEISGTENKDEIIYNIKDYGIGFNEKYKDKLFGVFQRLHSVKDYEGTGIGLAIVKRIVVRHGGRVWATGKENKGANFFFALPKKINSIKNN